MGQNSYAPKEIDFVFADGGQMHQFMKQTSSVQYLVHSFILPLIYPFIDSCIQDFMPSLSGKCAVASITWTCEGSSVAKEPMQISEKMNCQLKHSLAGKPLARNMKIEGNTLDCDYYLQATVAL